MEYLKRILGIDVVYLGTVFMHLPNFIRTRYRLQEVSLSGLKVIFVYPKIELERVELTKKHLAKIQQEGNMFVVLILEHITSHLKELLLREKIAFIVEGKQIYLPFMATYLQERCDAEKIQREKILPSAQMLLLHFIYSGAKDMSTSQAAKDLQLTPTSISRASKELETLGLVKARINGVQKILFSDETPSELFARAKKCLISPVKKIVYISKDLLESELLESGYLALAEYSMLNTPNVNCYASTKISQWNGVLTKYLQDSRTQVAVEMWRYDPRRLSNGKAVDELSLALALQHDTDERVEEAVEDMLNALWRRIDGSGN